MKIAKWGNSLAVRVPSAVVNVLDLKEGDDIEVRIAGPRALEIARSPDRAELLRRLEAFEGRWPADFKFDRDEANER